MNAITSRIEREVKKGRDTTIRSSLYQGYLARIVELENKFVSEALIVDAQNSPYYDNDPTNIFDQDYLRSFRLLCHAETEYLLENLAIRLSDAEYKSWKDAGIPSDIVVNIVACHYSGWDKLDCSVKDFKPLSEQQIKKHDGLVTLAATEKAYGAYKYNLIHNHGVKENNFRNMFMPLGILERDHQDLISNLESFGSLRGLVAHTGKAVSHQINPIDEKELIIEIAIGIYKLDEEIDKRLSNQGNAMLQRLNEMAKYQTQNA
ncbi:TPA: hypothetical protein O8U20_004074 [Enterobacter cloacae]|uniref:HEPN domain-containing protein n=1 Tax=Enterobacter cloacae TaxID=550 RepID=UPI001D0036DF|nr:HEPN domain-containing protein [Enterobacter cloacae]UDG02234.1 hypothetical protein LH408_07265 [Enterobacter cloacae]HDC4406224.1 hypothetical protein [Enterobacter cloacae]HDC4602592.1 hypothetical protein [Enterobacter cloacae]